MYCTWYLQSAVESKVPLQPKEAPVGSEAIKPRITGDVHGTLRSAIRAPTGEPVRFLEIEQCRRPRVLPKPVTTSFWLVV